MSILLTAALCASMFTGCGAPKQDTGTQNPETTTPPATTEGTATPEETTKSADPVELSTVSMFGGTDPYAPVYNAINEQFMKDNPNVTIKDDSAKSNEEWKIKVAADFSVGNEPDVLYFFTDSNAQDVLKANKFVPVADIQAEFPEYAADIKPDVLKNVATPEGVTFAVPVTGYYEGLFCNKDLFEQHNIELPTTWENLLVAIDKFNEVGITPVAVSLNEVPHYWIDHLILSVGGVEGHAQNPKDAANLPQDWIKALEYFQILRDKNAFPKDTDVIKDADAGNLFKSKKAAMQLDGSWFANGVAEAGGQDTTVILPFPVVPEGKKDPSDIVSGFSSGFYITKKAWEDPAKKQAAVDFVMAHTSTNSVADYWQGSGTPAAACEVPENLDAMLTSGATMAANAKGLDCALDARLKPEAFKTMTLGISDVSKGKVTAEALIAQIVDINAK